MHSVYIVDSNGVFKIGIARNVQNRIKQLQTSNPYKLWLATAYYKVLLASKIERSVHRKLADYNLMGEWFNQNRKKSPSSIGGG
jgi:hypothetical protein